ncbi:MAG: nucleoside-diphosphate kinase [Thermoguttaceae bacterium]|nr:nucleoside-diphosphate kinase [Thermoguttaceae bacterium]
MADYDESVLDKTERTLVLLKPDAVARCLAGEILHRFERKGLKIAAVKGIVFDRPLCQRHYREHVGKPYFEAIVSYMTGGPSIALILSGPKAVAQVRQLVGPTDSSQAPAGTIRGDLALDFRHNLVHASDSTESAQREIPLFFKPEEFLI